MIWGKYRSSNHMHQLNLNNIHDLETLKQFRISVKSHNKEVREGKTSGPQVYIKLCGRGPRREAEKIDGVRKGQYQSYLPLRHAKYVDVYMYHRYNCHV